MENRKNSPIRMSLIETIMKSLNEDLLTTAARENRIIASELEGYLKMMTKDAKVANELRGAGIRTSEELLTALKGNRLTSTLKGSLELSVLKSNTKNAKLIELASENLVRNKAFDKKYAAEIAKGQPAFEKALKQAGYSEDAITKIVQKKFNLPKPKPTTPNPKPTTPPPPKVTEWWKRWKNEFLLFLKKKPNWKQVLAWGAGLGIGASALWWMINQFASDQKMEDYPPVPPVDDTAWAPCIQQLLKSKEGVIAKSTKGEISVMVKNTEYPSGILFYSNGRVLDVAGKKKGSWKCKGGVPTIQAESKIISLSGLLNEQGSEVSDQTMDSYVDTAVDDLDGYVGDSNLQSLKNILTALRGKTYKGENAIKKFLDFYKQDEGVDFVSDVQSVGVANLSVMAKNMKPEIIALTKGGGGSPTPQRTKGGKRLTDTIDITWDGAKKDNGKKDDGKKITKSKKGVNYHDCSGKDTFEFGCISPKIAEIQGCLGITPKKGYFGPKTKTTLEGLGYDMSKGITLEMYNDVKSKCDSTRKKYSDTELQPISRPKIGTLPTGNLGDLSGKIKPIGGLTNNGEAIYKMLQSNYGDGSNPEFPYIFSEGGRLKYKGELMGGDAKDQLSQYVATLGYREEPIKDKDKSYGVKYVWVKQ